MWQQWPMLANVFLNISGICPLLLSPIVVLLWQVLFRYLDQRWEPYSALKHHIASQQNHVPPEAS